MSFFEGLRRRSGTVAAGLLVLAGASGAAAYRKRPLDVPIVVVDRGTVAREAAGTGTLESEAIVQLAFTLPGRLEELGPAEGAEIAVGQRVGRIDVSGIERERSVARAGVALASAGIAKADAEIARATAVRDAAALDQKRLRALVEAGAVSRAELDAVDERVSRSEAELAAARAARTQNQSSVSVASETVALTADKLDDGQLASPLAGVVLKRHHEPGDVVAPGAPVLTVASTRKVWARVWMDETSLHALRLGAEARVVLRGDEARPLRARVDRIAPEADRQTHEVLVDLELLERPARLVFGQRVDAFVLLDERRDVLRAPRSACDASAGHCLVDRGGVARRVPVQPGLVGNERFEIVGGLSEGDAIVDLSRAASPPPEGRPIRRADL